MEKLESSRKIISGIKVIAIIYYLASVLYLAIAVIAFLFPNLIFQIPDFSKISHPRATLILGIVFIFLSAFSAIVATGIFKLKNWARIALLVFCALNIIGGIISIIEKSYLSAINLIFNLAIASYLIFSKKVRISFHPKKEYQEN